ncbi:hypothetical protein WCLP8_5290007 [uncultured Gammaproteobacteria bacterium]
MADEAFITPAPLRARTSPISIEDGGPGVPKALAINGVPAVSVVFNQTCAFGRGLARRAFLVLAALPAWAADSTPPIYELTCWQAGVEVIHEREIAGSPLAARAPYETTGLRLVKADHSAIELFAAPGHGLCLLRSSSSPSPSPSPPD